MKKMLCSVMIAALALNTVPVFAQDTQKVSEGVEMPDGVTDEIGDNDASVPVSRTYELENITGIKESVEEKEKSQTLTRDMLMQELYDIAGRPEVAVSGSVGVAYFDSEEGPAAIWSYYNEIMYGYGEDEYGKADIATREQLAAMLFRFADGKVPNLLLNFSDAEDISGWAQDSMRWAVSEGILTADDDNMISPKDAATVYDMNNALRILGLK